jgi:hypothetical protein
MVDCIDEIKTNLLSWLESSRSIGVEFADVDEGFTLEVLDDDSSSTAKL